MGRNSERDDSQGCTGRGNDGLTHVERAYQRKQAQANHPASQPTENTVDADTWASFVEGHTNEHGQVA